MSKYQVADQDTKDVLNDLLFKFAEAHDGTYQSIIDSRLKIEVLFAFGDRDENGNLVSDAITKNGVKALGQCSIINLKNRSAGRGDVEILLDGDFWETAGDARREALLDHELFHIAFKLEKDGTIKRDDLSRPLVRMRKHDYEFGWFATIAARHGDYSVEREQAKLMMDENGQAFWGEIIGTTEAIRRSVEKLRPKKGSGVESVTISSGDGKNSVTLKAEG